MLNHLVYGTGCRGARFFSVKVFFVGYIKYFKNILFLIEPRKGNKLQGISGSYNFLSSEKKTCIVKLEFYFKCISAGYMLPRLIVKIVTHKIQPNEFSRLTVSVCGYLKSSTLCHPNRKLKNLVHGAKLCVTST